MRILVISILVLVIAIGGWVVLNKDNSSSPEAENNISTQDVPLKTEESLPEVNTDTEQSLENTQKISVSYTSSGFSPSTLTINAGDTVVFTNDTNIQMWVASNPHPIHTDLSEFDNRRGVSNGETYKFTFETPGEYFYHNHMNFSDGGTIIVK